MSAETNGLIRSGRLDGHLYHDGHHDPEQRMCYPCLPQDRTKLTADLAAIVDEPRPGLRCIVARCARNGAPNALLDERVAVVDAFGADMDIYGRAPWRGPNGWLDRSSYRGAVVDKIGTLRGYDFTLAYENCDVPGYVSEKLFDALRAGARSAQCDRRRPVHPPLLGRAAPLTVTGRLTPSARLRPAGRT